MQVTREELQELVKKKLGLDATFSFARLMSVFFPDKKRLRANVSMELSDKKFRQGVSQLAKEEGVEDPFAKQAKSKSTADQPPPSTETALLHVAQSRRFRPTHGKSSRPTKEDSRVIDELQKELQKYWKHESEGTIFRPEPERDGSKWVYPDPMLPGEVIRITATDQEAYVQDPDLSYQDRSPAWMRKLEKLLGELSIVRFKCEHCGLDLDPLLKPKAHALLDKRFRLPLAPMPPRAKGDVRVISFKRCHDDCRIMYPEYVAVLTELKGLFAELKAMPKGKEKKQKKKELQAIFRERAKLVYRNAAEQLQQELHARGVKDRQVPKVDLKVVRTHAAAIIESIEEGMSDG